MKYEKKSVQLSQETLTYIERGEGNINIIMLHGNMSGSVHYLPLLERIGDKYHCYAVDMRGFGDSTYNNRFESLRELAQDIKEFADALGINRAYVIGWSTGGGVAMELAAAYPQLVEKVFSIEGAGLKGYPIFKKDSNFQPQLGQVYATREEMAFDPVQVAPAQIIIDNKDAQSMTALWNYTIYTVNKPSTSDNALYMEETLKQRCLADLDWALANFNMSAENNFYRQGDNTISCIKCRCAFTSGDKDIVVPSYMVMENVNALADNATFLPYENCGHSPLVDCPDKLAQDITEFFGE